MVIAGFRNDSACLPSAVISCGHPGHLPNGTVSGDLSFVFNTTVSYSCNRSFTMTGPSQITCGETGIWEPVEEQNCYIITCPTLSTTGEVRSNTSYSPVTGQLTVDHEEQFSCSPGYILLGANVTTCQVSGQWSNPVPKCQILDCGEPLSTNHSTVIQKSNTTYNSSVMYQCDTGFNQSTGDYQRTCLETGEWSGSALQCSGKWNKVPLQFLLLVVCTNCKIEIYKKEMGHGPTTVGVHIQDVLELIAR